MKVAIIGAGISGLSCAIELQRHGIAPAVFERTKTLGEKPCYLVSTLRMFHRSFRNPMRFFKSQYDIEINPLHPLKEMLMITQYKTVLARGNLGFVFEKGTGRSSLEHQLAAYLDIPISFDKDIKLQDINKYFDHIVVAAGNNTIAKDLNLWNTTFTAKCRIATVSGHFRQDAMILWLNKSYANGGYGYLLARNTKEAEIVLAVSDITMDKLEYYWNEFLIAENINFPVVKCHDIEHVIGYPSSNRLGNIYFTGNCGGMIDDFLGFGMSRAIESGILAARAIARGLDYDRLLKPFKREVNRLSEYRKMISVLENTDYDLYMSILGLPGIKQAIYNNPLYKSWYGVLAPKTIVGLKKRNYPFKLQQRKKE